VVHGTEDATVPYSHGIRLHEMAPEPKFFTWIHGGSHNDIYTTYSDVYYSSLRKFTEFLSEN
jgi:fermentation-respiration switch protein FrsA (DUF1100 family)